MNRDLARHRVCSVQTALRCVALATRHCSNWRELQSIILQKVVCMGLAGAAIPVTTQFEKTVEISAIAAGSKAQQGRLNKIATMENHELIRVFGPHMPDILWQIDVPVRAYGYASLLATIAMAGGWSKQWHHAIDIKERGEGTEGRGGPGGMRERGGKLPGSIAQRIRPDRAGARRPTMKDTAFWHAVACVCSGVSHIASLEYVRWKFGTQKTDIWSMLEIFFNCKQDVLDSDGEADIEGEDNTESIPLPRARKPVRVQTQRSPEECVGWQFAATKITSVLYPWPMDLDGVDNLISCALYVERIWKEVEWDLADDAGHEARLNAE
eukprot:3664282-Rhodomonas_salina.1